MAKFLKYNHAIIFDEFANPGDAGALLEFT